ncbi:hypothetical protein LSH36_120g16054 [Paralvinella palmiformis]|uniref:phosphatidate cytidylyltransferase n=1 Tax=Paralvinella palmiformis TaxID=53620 RepID=A0AAD9N8P5_9ANNE|nr:hypothetical protein LSH36_120g16054 [Paralvinella palmiformis]
MSDLRRRVISELSETKENVLLIQMKCFHEIITIGYAVYKSHDLPWFRTLSWYFLITSNYFFYGESLIQYFGVLLSRTEFALPFVTYHRFISFALYCSGLVGFVFSLVKKHYLKQFTLFGWTHVTLLLIVTQSHLIIQNTFEGLVWFLVPVSMIICNDIMAYLFGFFFGRTPLIKLSPKKTWEGFIGGAFSTIIFGLIISYGLVQFDYFVCPIEYDEVKESLSLECERAPVFKLTEYTLPKFVQSIGKVDFGDTIPGHGGFMDRFDCQLLMATFVHVYHTSFIKAVSPGKMVQLIMALKPEEQIQVFNMLRETLIKRGLLALK